MNTILPTTLVGSYPQPDWLIDRAKLAGRFPPRARASMKNKKSASSKNARRGAERSHQKLAENFLARLDRTWQQHGREVLDRVMAERPEL